MLEDLDNSLERLLANKLHEASLHSESYFGGLPNSKEAWRAAISFDPPSAPRSGLNINLFLYDIRENLDLRQPNWSTERRSSEAGKPFTVRIPPVARVDCSYLITVWPDGRGASSEISKEHLLLGTIMRILLSHRTLPSEYLQDSLEDQDLPVKLISLRPGNLQGPGEYWQALGDGGGSRPKAVLHCTVTIPVPPYIEPEENISLVGVYQPQSST